MTNLTKLTKAQLIDLIQQQEEEKYSVLKEETGLPYDSDEEWVKYIQKLQDHNASRINDCEELIRQLQAQTRRVS